MEGKTEGASERQSWRNSAARFCRASWTTDQALASKMSEMTSCESVWVPLAMF